MSHIPTHSDLDFLIDNNPDLFYVCNLDGQLIKWNKAIESLTGLSADELLNKPAVEFVVKEDQETLVRGIQQVFNTGFSTLEARFLDQNSVPIPYLCNGTAIKDKNGKLVGFSGTGRDISDQKQAELTREKNLTRQQQLNQLQEYLLGPGLLVEKLKLVTQGVVETFNADFCRIWIVKRGDLCDSGCIHRSEKTSGDVCKNSETCLHLLASSGRYTHTDGGHQRVPFGAYKIGRLASGPHTQFLTNNVTEDQQINDREWAKKLGLKSFAGYQLRDIKGETQGVLALFSKHSIEPEEKTLLKNLGNNIAQVIQTSMAVESLKKSEEKYRSLSSNIPGMIYRRSSDWSTELVSNSKMICGYSADEFTAKKVSWLDLIHLDDKDWVFEEENKLSAKAMTIVQEYRIIEKNGITRWISDHKTSCFNTDGTFVGVDGIVYDITNRKMVEEELQTYRESLEKLVDARTFELAQANEELRLQAEVAANMSEGVYLLKVSSEVIIYTNPRFEEIFGYKSGDLLNKHASVIYASSKGHPAVKTEHLVKMIKEVGVWQGEIKTIKKDGTPFWCYVSSSIFIHPEFGEIIVSVHSDIDDRKQIEEKLRQAKRVAEKANTAKSEFLANMSHEIRTPLNAIIGMSRLAVKTDLSPDQKYYLDTVYQSGEMLLNLINDILDLSKIEAGQIELEKRPFDLQELINSVVDMFRFKAQEKSLSLSASISQPKRHYQLLVGDEYRLRQVLTNLVGNAIKFTDKGEVTVLVDPISNNNANICLQFSVSDTGVGIPLDGQGKIFESFFQADSSITRIHGGTGLGLTISKKLTELMDGRIWLESEFGQGSTFYFTATFSKAEKSLELPTKNDLPLTATSSTQSLDILLVEDNAFNRDLARIVLEDRGHTVSVAENGHEALKQLTQNDVDVILMDVQMPVMDGITATRLIRQCEEGKIREEHQHVKLLQKIQKRIGGTHLPIVAMTAHAMAGDRDECIKAGMNDYISKPFHPDDVFGVLSRLCVSKAEL